MNVHQALFLGVATFAITISTAAAAQSSSTASYSESDTIVVTARRMEENLQDVPISITVFTEAQIADRNITSSNDLANYTPSLTTNSRFGPEKASFAIRGFSQDLSTLPTVAVYFADVVAPRLQSNITSGNGAGPGSMFDLQNVQVLKGPQGTLFGRNTTGGAILLVPRKPTDYLEGYVEGTIGNYDQMRLQGALNLPLAETFKIRVGFDRNKRDGYIKSLSGVGPRDFNDIDYFAARLSILAELTPNLENYSIFHYTHSDNNGTLGKYAYCNRGTSGTGGFGVNRVENCAAIDAQAGFAFHESTNANPNAYVESTTWQAINTTTWRANDWLTVKNIASYGEAKEGYSLNISGDFVEFPGVTTHPGPNGNVQGNQYSFTEELQFQGDHEGLTWQAGGYFEQSKPTGKPQEQYTVIFARCTDIYAFECTPKVFFGRPVGSVSITRNNYDFKNRALYAQGTYDLTDQFSITGGFRYTWDRIRGTGDGIAITPSPTGPVGFRCSQAVTLSGAGAELLTNGACFRSFVQSSSKPTWLINLDYRPTPDILLYAKYARGYRGGGANQGNPGFETWGPEKLDNYELGLKATIRAGAVRGTFNIAGFWNDFQNQQGPVSISQCVIGRDPGCTNPAPVGIRGIENLGSSEIKGVEVDGSLTFFDDLRIDYGYAYLDAKVKEAGLGGCDASRFDCANAEFLQAGTRLPFSPKHRFTTTGTYTLPLDEAIGEVSIGATFTYTSSQITSYSSFAAFEEGVIPYNAGITPSTSLLDLNLNWKNIAGSQFDLGLFATNVTNEKYYVASGGGLSTNGADFIFLGAPRIYGARLRFTFGR